MKRFWMIIVSLILGIAFTIPVFAESQDMWAYVYKDTGKIDANGRSILTRIESGVTFNVRSIDSDVNETITYYGGSTSLTNPVTTTNFAATTVCNKMVAFRVDPTDATADRYVDVIVVDTDGGFTRVVKNFDKYTHTIVIDERPNVVHHGLIWYSGTTTSNISTGITFQKNTMIHDVRLDVVTATPAGSTLSVGLVSYDYDGLIASRLLSTAGFVKDTGVITSGTSEDYVAATTYGALLYTSVTGLASPKGGAASYVSTGGRSYLGHIVATAASGILQYTTDSADGATRSAGYIHYWFSKLR